MQKEVWLITIQRKNLLLKSEFSHSYYSIDDLSSMNPDGERRYCVLLVDVQHVFFLFN